MADHKHGNHTHPDVKKVLAAMIAQPRTAHIAATMAVEAAQRAEKDPADAYKRSSRAHRDEATAVHQWVTEFLRPHTGHGRHQQLPARPAGLEGYCEQACLAWDALTDRGWTIVAVDQLLLSCHSGGWAGRCPAIIRRSLPDRASSGPSGYEYAVLAWKMLPHPRTPWPADRLELCAYAGMQQLLEDQGRAELLDYPQPISSCLVHLYEHSHYRHGMHGQMMAAGIIHARALAGAYHWIEAQK